MVELLSDCRKIQEIAARELHVIISLEQAEAAWELHSESLAAGWLHIEETAVGVSEVKDAVRSYLEKAFRKLAQIYDPQ